MADLDGLLANLDKIKSERTREKLAAGRPQIEQNRKMVELDCETPLPVPIDDLRIEPDYPALIAALEKCEFKSLLQEVQDEAAKAGTRRRRNCSCRGPVGGELRTADWPQALLQKTADTAKISSDPKKNRTAASSRCQIIQVKAIRAAARFLVFVVSPACAARILFFGRIRPVPRTKYFGRCLSPEDILPLCIYRGIPAGHSRPTFAKNACIVLPIVLNRND